MRKEAVRQSRYKLSCCVKQIKCTPKYSYNDGNKEQSAGYAWARRYYCSSTSRHRTVHSPTATVTTPSEDRLIQEHSPTIILQLIRNLYEGEITECPNEKEPIRGKNHAASAVNGNRFGENRRVIPSSERALTGGLKMVMTATPSARTSMVVMPLAIYGNGYQ